MLKLIPNLILFLIPIFILIVYSSKFVGEFQLQLEGEQELVHFTVRTLKVGRSHQLKLVSLPDQALALDSRRELKTLDKS